MHKLITLAEKSRAFLIEERENHTYNLWHIGQVYSSVHGFTVLFRTQLNSLTELTNSVEPWSLINVRVKTAVEKWWGSDGKKIIAEIIKKAAENPNYEKIEDWSTNFQIKGFLDKLATQATGLASDASYDLLYAFGMKLEKLGDVLRSHVGKENARTGRTKDYREVYGKKLSTMFDAAIKAYEDGLEYRQRLGTPY
jgi:hypothetical protein